MNVRLAFGRNGVDVELPGGFDYEVLEARSAKPVADAGEAIRRALDEPIAGPPLSQIAAGRRSAAISVCDITRPGPNR